MQNKPKPDEYMCYVHTEGVTYVIDWRTFPVGGSVFIRCLDTKSVRKQILTCTEQLNIRTSYRTGVKNGCWGIGIWRIA